MPCEHFKSCARLNIPFRDNRSSGINKGNLLMKRILVVDDELGARTLIGIMLDRGGFEVWKAHDAIEALKIIEQGIPDLIILDIMMPGMDGFELCRRIRQRPEDAELPILLLSTRSDYDSVVKGMEAGASDYLPKPILHHDLVSKVKQMLKMDLTPEN
jgi:DNA-binding response OmpR family regulator